MKAPVSSDPPRAHDTKRVEGTTLLNLALTGGLVSVIALTGAFGIATAEAPISLPDDPAETFVLPKAPRTAQDYTRAFEKMNMPAWNGADVATAIPLGDGKILWLFGDTLKKDGTYTSNSFLIQDGEKFTYQNAARIPDEGGTRFWPMQAWRDGDTVWVTLQDVRMGKDSDRSIYEPQDLHFKVTGSSLAEMRYVNGDLVFIARHDLEEESNGIVWGSAVGDEDLMSSNPSSKYVYLFGTRDPDRPYVFGKDMYVSRVKRSAPQKASSWWYWNGQSWSKSSSDAVVVKPGEGGVSTIFSAHRTKDGKWVLVTKKDEFLGNKIIALTSNNPQGPYQEQEIGTAENGDDVVLYSVVAHPEIQPESKDGIVVSVNQNSLDMYNVEPEVYRPHFEEVLIDGGADFGSPPE